MRPDTPADHVDHIAEAERLERTAGLYPEDAEHLLLQAAAHLELADARDRATTLYDNLLSPSAAHPPENPTLIRALKAANLWEYGHEAEARAIIDGVRGTAPADAAPWVIVAEALEAHDELDQAHETFTQALTRLLPAAPDTAAPAEPPYPTHPLLFGRHRVRRLLGAEHDAWDGLADRVHRSRAAASGRAPVPLDELHDPKRVWALGSENPEDLRAEITRLQSELGSYREALSRPFPVAVLHWPATELTELLTAYPTLATEYPSHEAHLSTIESSLRELSASGTANLGIVTGTVPSYEAFAASEGASADDPSLLPQYATTLAARGRAAGWPPEAGAGCWCGSGRAYGECHGGG
ncbi:SEC-C domain-containing protein [Streptomyces flavofungini]|uniref:SEC-C domain-containing protein n=1 Tax=Streptomyces flavofungini TaxID=68200 RepID=UPI0025B0AF9E|nr:SEC-C domain-containing protein [Streptomyces flavofungini]WJV48488.1 SEC-C domain-containing protein [Streptomyces flavofungini]